MTDVARKIEILINNIEKVVVGKEETIRFLIVGLITNGHILIEDVPGLGKTMLSLALSKSIGGAFKRIQFTPDLLPSDVTGGYIYNPKIGEFEVKKGPVFTNILLADELNRTTPRTQSSLLECMQEHKVTLEGKTFPLEAPFIVVATQNPIEFQGTYPLPEAQMDRFLMKIDIGYLPVEEEVKVIRNQKEIHPIETLEPVLNLEEVRELQKTAKEVEISEKILNYIVRLVSQTRQMEDVKVGASPRASISFMHSARAWAMLEERDYVIPDDVFHLAFPILRHRLIIKPKSSALGITPKKIIQDLLNKVSVS